jgi:hypothetical protein
MTSSTFSLLVLEKSGTLHEKNVKGLDRLYSLCNYRSEEGFESLHSWTNAQTIYQLYGKRKGKNNYENKCVLPQPIHQEQFYGNLCIVKKVHDMPQSLTIEEWTHFIDQVQESETKPEFKELKKEDYE